MVSEKGTKKANVDLIDTLDLQNRIKKLFEDFNRMLKAKKVNEAKKAKEAELKVKKKLLKYLVMKEILVMKVFFGDEDLVLSRAPTTATRSRALIASTSNAQVASTPLRGYRKIAMRGCVLGLRAPNDPNAPPPSTTRKRKARPDLLYVDV
ncbi:hypothetical protein Tco_1323693 [Tanacetum coccineum]